MVKRFITQEARELAKQLHLEEHKIIDKKAPKFDHKLYDYYYLMASGIFDNLAKKIDDSNVELFNKLVDLQNEVSRLSKQMKEVSKQQKYLWQTLDEKNDVEVGLGEGGQDD